MAVGMAFCAAPLQTPQIPSLEQQAWGSWVPVCPRGPGAKSTTRLLLSPLQDKAPEGVLGRPGGPAWGAAGPGDSGWGSPGSAGMRQRWAAPPSGGVVSAASQTGARFKRGHMPGPCLPDPEPPFQVPSEYWLNAVKLPPIHPHVSHV